MAWAFTLCFVLLRALFKNRKDYIMTDYFLVIMTGVVAVVGCVWVSIVVPTSTRSLDDWQSRGGNFYNPTGSEIEATVCVWQITLLFIEVEEMIKALMEKTVWRPRSSVGRYTRVYVWSTTFVNRYFDALRVHFRGWNILEAAAYTTTTCALVWRQVAHPICSVSKLSWVELKSVR